MPCNQSDMLAGKTERRRVKQESEKGTKPITSNVDLRQY